MLSANGTFNQCRLPNENLPLSRSESDSGTTDGPANGGHLSVSYIGNIKESYKMLYLVAKHGVKTWIEENPPQTMRGSSRST